MKNYVDIATKIQMNNNYTFKKKDDLEFIDEVSVNNMNNISQISQMNPLNEISQFNNNISEIHNNNTNRDFNFVNDMIPLTNTNNISIHSKNFNINNVSKISQDKNSSFTKYLHMIPGRNTSGIMKDESCGIKEQNGDYSRNTRKYSTQPNEIKNFINNSNIMTGFKENIIPEKHRRSEINSPHLTKFITRNLLNENVNLSINKGGKFLNKSTLSQANVRITNENFSTALEANSYRERTMTGKHNHSFNVINNSDLSPNRRILIKNLDPRASNNYNNNMSNMSPKFLPTFSQHNQYNQYNPPPTNLNGFLNSKNRKNFTQSNEQVNYNSPNEINSYNSVLSGKKRVTKVFDYNKPPPIKKGIFSYSKPSSSVGKLQEENTKFDLNTFANSLNKNGSNLYSAFSNFNDLNSISRHLAALQNNEIQRVGSQSLLDNSSISMVEKYQVKKDMSNPNLNRSDNISNIADETDKISVNSMKSGSSFNFNKYKVGMGAYSTSKITMINDNTDVSDLSTLIKYENSTNNTNNANYGKIVMAANNNNFAPQVPSKSDRPVSSQISDLIINNNSNNNEKIMSTDSEGLPNSMHNRTVSKDINAKILTKPSQVFTDKPPHERESRRMQVELLKMKMRERIGKGGQADVKKIIHELKLNPIILDKPVIIENTTDTNSIPNPSAGSEKKNLQDDPRLQSILKRGKIVENDTNNNTGSNKNNGSFNTNLNENFSNNNQNFNTPVPYSESASSYLNTVKSTAHLNYSLEEDSNDRISMLCYLITPRILYINLPTSINKTQKVPFIFQLIPSNSCHKHGLEHYIFQWNDVNNLNPVSIIEYNSINFRLE